MKCNGLIQHWYNKIGLILPDFKIYKATVFKTLWYCKERQISKWNRMESLEIDS